MAVRPRRVSELMNPDVVTLRPDQSLVEAQQVLSSKSVSGAPVVDASGRVIGVVSQNDLVRNAAHPDTVAQAGQFFSSVEDYADIGMTLVAPSSQRVSDVLTPRVCQDPFLLFQKLCKLREVAVVGRDRQLGRPALHTQVVEEPGKRAGVGVESHKKSMHVIGRSQK